MRPYLPAVPLPPVGVLLSVGHSRGETLGAPWAIGGDREIQFFPRGFVALVHAAQCVAQDQERPVCFFPAYFCEGSLTPLRQAGARIIFYRVARDLTPDWEDVRRQAKAEHPDLFVLVHTFGCVQDTAEALAFAREKGCVVLEDAAHVLMPGGKLGEGGTIVLFSPHKLLALPPISLLSIPRFLSDRVRNPYKAAWRKQDWKWLVKRGVQKSIVVLGGLGIRAKARGGGFAGDEGGAPPVIACPHEISRLGARLLVCEQENVTEVARRRRQHFAFLSRAVAEMQDVKIPRPLAEWAADDVPYAFPFFAGQDRVAAVHSALWRLGIPALTWPDLPPEVTAQPEEYREALFWRRNLLLLPVHQSLTSRQLNFMASGLRRVLARICSAALDPVVA